MTGVIHITLECNAEEEDLHILEADRKICNCAKDHVTHVEWHRLIRLCGERDEVRLEVVCTCLPRKIERIDQDAVTADTRTRIEWHEAEWLRRCCLDHFPH